MVTLPLYPAAEVAPIERAQARALDRECTRCPHHRGASQGRVCLPAEGEPGGLLVVSDYPGRDEDAQGIPMAGAAGKLARDVVARHWSGPVAWDNALRCLRREGTDLEQKHVDACRPFLAETYRQVRPQRVLALGPWAMLAVLGRSHGPRSVRRAFAWTQAPYAGVPVFLGMNPAAAARNRFLRAEFEADVAWALTCEPPRPRARDLVVVSRETLAAAREALEDAPWIAVDSETVGAMHDPDFAVASVGACAPDGPVFVWEEEALGDAACVELLRELLTGPVPKVEHETKYDSRALLLALGVETAPLEDTLLRRALLDPGAEGALEVAAEQVGLGGHKEDQKREIAASSKALGQAVSAGQGSLFDRDWMLTPAMEADIRERGDWSRHKFAMTRRETHWRYVARDAATTADLFDAQGRRMVAEAEAAYEYRELVRPAIAPMARMEHNGIAVNVPAVKALGAILAQRIEEAQARLRGHADINWASGPQVRKYLFERLGLQPTKKTKTGLSSVDEEVLEELAPECDAAADLLLLRGVEKLRGTYVDGKDGKGGLLKHVRADGRVHPWYHIDGAESARLSASAPSIQNQPSPNKDREFGALMRDCYVARDGWSLVEGDQAQVELRVMAMLSGDERMREAFLSGRDFHQQTAEMIAPVAWGLRPDQVDAGHRDQGKITNFGLAYGKGDASLARDLSNAGRTVTVAQAARIREAIYGGFRQLAAWFQQLSAYVHRHGHVWTYWRGKPARKILLTDIADRDEGRREHAERAARASTVQGTANYFTLASIIAIDEWIQRAKFPARLVLTVHDSLMAEVRDDCVQEYVSEARRIMTQWDPLLAADFKVGKAWGSLKKVKA